MDRCEDREDIVPASKTSLGGDAEEQSKAQRGEVLDMGPVAARGATNDTTTKHAPYKPHPQVTESQLQQHGQCGPSLYRQEKSIIPASQRASPSVPIPGMMIQRLGDRKSVV